MEIWRDIPDFQGYQISNLGQVRTHNKITSSNLYKERHWKDKILKFKSKNYKTGYRVDLWKDGKPHTMLVARLVAFTFYEEDINNYKLTVNHIDGNRFNNNLDNLELITLKDNIRHAFRTGLQSSQIKVKIEDKITGTIIYPSSLSEGSKLINRSHSYLHEKVKNNIFEDDRYKWEVLC